jgi:ureidoacrylate peracid hydrolase
MHDLGSANRNSWRVTQDAVDMIRPIEPVHRVSIAATPQRVTFDLARAALLVIDMQNDFCDPAGWLASIGVDTAPARAPIPALQTLLPAFRGAGGQVLWVNWGNRPDRLNLSPSLLHVYNPDGAGNGLGQPLPHNGSRTLEAGSWGAAITTGLEPTSQDLHVAKYRMSGFWDTPLDSILRNLDIRTLLFAGVNIDQCVMATLQDANFLGYDCILVEDACATTSPEFCTAATLYNVRQCFGFVTQSAALVAAL